MIRRRLAEGRADPARRLPSVTLFAICIKALNDTLSRFAKRRLYLAGHRHATQRTGEQFPRLNGYTGLRESAGTAPRSEAQPCCREAEAALLDPGVYTMTVETISPDRAEEYLAANRGNRNIVQSHVAAMARDIRNGQWMFNAQPICFSRSGRLLNGQHRLSAVLEAGQPIEVLVMRGLPEQAFQTYDKQAKKAPAIDEMFDDFGDKALISASAVLLWRRELRPANEPDARPTASEIRGVITAHPQLLRLRGFARKLVRYGRSSALVYAAYRVLRDNSTLGQVFLEPAGDCRQPTGRPRHPAAARPADRSAKSGSEHANRRNPCGLGTLPQAAGNSTLKRPWSSGTCSHVQRMLRALRYRSACCKRELASY